MLASCRMACTLKPWSKMLQTLDSEQQIPESDSSHLLRGAYYFALLKRRWVYFLIPFISVLLAGTAVLLLWPPTYYSEGKILVQSQQIPTELVRPTVTSAAQERIQVIEQRTMTRDNLLAIVDKFKLFPARRTLMSPTQLVELMKKDIKIEPFAQQLAFARGSSTNPTVIFTVGFEAGDPETAAKVANELITRVLNEDLRDRTSRATDTTKFLAREVQRLQTESNLIDAKIAQSKILQVNPRARTGADQGPAQLSQLRAELAQKSAIYSDRNFQIQTLKRQIAAMEKAAVEPVEAAATGSDPQTGPDVIEAQQANAQKNLEIASAKLSAARLGETLERDQQSEKLEVIDQPTLSREPISPNRPKIAGIIAVLALMAGAGIAVVSELLDGAIRRSSDLFAIVDSQLIVSIPYISTVSELRRRKIKIWSVVAILVLVFAVAIAAAIWLLPPIDLLIAKARVGLFR
jgi:capsular polysaccharide biosynthesis protein